MNLEKFQEKDRKKQVMIIGGILLILLITVVMIYRSYAIYEQKQEYDVIQGQVPDQNYDAMLVYILEDESGNRRQLDIIPEGKDYNVSVSCNNNATGEWDYKSWGLKITNLSQSRTKCKVTFGPLGPLGDYGIRDILVTSGNGIYEVPHNDAEITYTTDSNLIQVLKQTEYRYAGVNPNNYVEFNDELWRIIGLVNTPEGQRIKIIRNESIGSYSWDTSDVTINSGSGVNEWSQADLMTILNYGAYYNRTSGTCYNGLNNVSTSCDFSSTGLTENAKKMIDTVTWNTGGNGSTDFSSITSIQYYNYERSNNTGKICSSGIYCNDTVMRTTSWYGQVGLMYPSDYGYATSGGTTTNRMACLNKSLYDWRLDDVSDCRDNNWLYQPGSTKWLLTPYATSDHARHAFILRNSGYVSFYYTYNADAPSTHPTVYLTSNVKVIDGNGSVDSPYLLGES